MNHIGKRFENVHISKCSALGEELIGQGIDWCQNPHSLVITGDVGRGKTQFMLCLVKEAIRLYGLSSVQWTKAKDLNNEGLEAQFLCSPLLFIDDMRFDEGNYDHILDDRWSNNLPTIINTIETHTQISAKTSERTFSRLKDSRWIQFEGPDLRGGN